MRKGGNEGERYFQIHQQVSLYKYIFSQPQQVYILHIHLLAMVHMTWGTWMCG